MGFLIILCILSCALQMALGGPVCKGGSVWKYCGTACPRDCCNNDYWPPPVCVLPCVVRCQCPSSKAEVYRNNSKIKKCVNPSECPQCPSIFPMKCRLIYGSNDFTVSITNSPDQAIRALEGAPGPFPTIGDNGVYTIKRGDNFYVRGISFQVLNAKRVIVKGFNARNVRIFKKILKPGGNQNAGLVYDGVCTLPKKTVRKVTLEFKSKNSNDIRLGALFLNGCCINPI